MEWTVLLGHFFRAQLLLIALVNFSIIRVCRPLSAVVVFLPIVVLGFYRLLSLMRGILRFELDIGLHYDFVARRGVLSIPHQPHEPLLTYLLGLAFELFEKTGRHR